MCLLLIQACRYKRRRINVARLLDENTDLAPSLPSNATVATEDLLYSPSRQPAIRLLLALYDKELEEQTASHDALSQGVVSATSKRSWSGAP